MDDYLNKISTGTSVSSLKSTEVITSSDSQIIEAQFSSELTKSGSGLKTSDENTAISLDSVYDPKSVKVTKFKLYKNKGK